MIKRETFIDVLLKFPEDIKKDYKNSKLPDFIKKFLIKRDLNKIYKSIDRLITENVVLEKPVLDQYLTIIENEFQPNPKYGVIYNLESTYNYDYNYKLIIGYISLGDTKYKIKTDLTDKVFEVEIFCKEEKPGHDTPLNKSYTFTDNKLVTKAPEYSEYVRELNRVLLRDITIYFKEYLKTNLGV